MLIATLPLLWIEALARCGRPQDGWSGRIEPTNLVDGVRWLTTNPLVFINGCHSTASTPEMSLEFVAMLTRVCLASAVIGAEVTIFEPLAT